jgi:hypothetical protein
MIVDGHVSDETMSVKNDKIYYNGVGGVLHPCITTNSSNYKTNMTQVMYQTFEDIQALHGP